MEKVQLMFEPTKWDHRYLSLAREVSTWSKDPSRGIGAVAVSSTGQVLATGYNGLPRGLEDSSERLNDREQKYALTVHAEMNCIFNATYNGICLNGSNLYVWGLPVCSDCAKGIIQVGVKNVYWGCDDYISEKWSESVKVTKQLFDEVGISINRIFVDT